MRLALRLILSTLSIVALALATAGVASAASRAHASIINGTIVSGPGPLALVASDVGQCSGSVISSNVILTAAHCVHDPDTGELLDPQSFIVQTSAARAWDPAGFFARGSRIVSSTWLPSNNFGDLALVQLASQTPAPTLPLAAPGETTLLTPGTVAVAEGWGIDVQGSSVTSVDLRAGAEVVQGPSYCSAQAQTFGVQLNTASTLCAIDTRALNSVCSGDSGGPLVAQRTDGTLAQIGITSFGATSCTPAKPQFFTRVDAFSNWITGWVAILAPPAPPTTPSPAPAPPAPAPAPVTPPSAPAATPSPAPAPPTNTARRYSRYTAHGGYLAASVSPDGQHVTWLRIGLQLTCKGGRHTYINDVFSAPAKTGWPMSARQPLRLTLTKPANRRFARRTDSISLAPADGGLYGSLNVSMRARARTLGSCAGSVRSFRLAA